MNEKQKTTLPKLEIVGVSVIAHYGNKTEFETVEEAVDYILKLSNKVGDPEAPLIYIKAQVEYKGNQSASVSFTSQELVIAWLKQGVFKK